MEISKEYIKSYFDKLLKKRATILAAIEKNPIKGIDISKLDNKQKLFLGGLQKLKFDIAAELIAIRNFIPLDSGIEEKQEVILKDILDNQIQLFDFEGDEIKFNENIDTILKDIK